MNKEILEKAIAAMERWKGFMTGSSVDVAIKEMKEQLKQMEPEVWIPPKRMIIEALHPISNEWLLRRSMGKLTEEGKLLCSGTPNIGYRKWTSIPLLAQFIKHDNSNKCPCKNVRTYVVYIDGEMGTIERPHCVGWLNISAWTYADDLVVE